MDFFEKEENEIKNIWYRIKNRDFSGNTGLAIKNSIYQFSTSLLSKIGSFVFTIILARLLLPELFGLYSLTLSTILIFVAFSDLGIGQTLIRFISKEVGKRESQIKPYLLYLGKIKLMLIIISSLLLLISANYLANNFYKKPIFLALLVGVLYIIFFQVFGFLQTIIISSNNFKPIFKRELIFQISRITLVPLAIVLATKTSLTNEKNLMIIIFFLAISFFLTSIFLFFDAKKIFSKILKTEKTKKLTQRQIKSVNKFLLATATLAFSGIFFANIDRVMLGVFVPEEFIGFYTAAFNLIGALIPITGFAAIVLLPIFSRLKGKRLEAGFKKSIKITLIISIAALLGIVIFTNFSILIVYGKNYLPAVNILRILSILLIALPTSGIYTTYLISQGHPQTVAKLLIIATILNVFLNYILITSLLPYGNIQAVYGAVIATLISQFFYLGGLVWSKRKIKEN